METEKTRWNLVGGKQVDPLDYLHFLKTLTPTRYTALPIPHVAGLLGMNYVYVSEVLDNLKRQPNTYVRLSSKVRERQDNTKQLYYEISSRGLKVLREQGEFLDGVHEPEDSRFFEHQGMIDTTWASLEIAVKADPTARFVYPDELLSHASFPPAQRAKKRPLTIPVKVKLNAGDKTHRAEYDYTNDGMRAIDFTRNGKTFRRYLQMEAENTKDVDSTNLAKRSFLRTFLAIKYVMERQLYKSTWGFGNLLTLVVCPSEAKIASMKSVVLRETAGKGAPYLLFKRIPIFPATTRPTKELYGPWERAGYEPLNLADPWSD